MVEEIINHLWQSTLFVIVIACLVALTKKNSASIRYGLWLMASIKFLLPFSLLILVGKQFSWLEVNSLSSQEINQIHWLNNLVVITEPLINHLLESSASGSNQSLSPSTENSTPTLNWLMLITLIWMIGSLMIIGRWFREWKIIRRIANSAQTTNLVAFPVPVKVTSDISSPAIFGIFNKTLLLPTGFLKDLERESSQAIIAHERAHLERKDNLTAAIHMVVEMIFWFHPFVWIIGNQLNRAREQACDEAVLQQGNNSLSYAESILKLCEHSVRSPLLCAAGSSGEELRSRIETIMSNKRIEGLTMFKRAALGLILSLTVTVPILFGSMSSKPVFAQTNTDPTIDSEARFESIEISLSGGRSDTARFVLEHKTGISMVSFPIREMVASVYDVQRNQVVLPEGMENLLLNIEANGGAEYTGEFKVGEDFPSVIRSKMKNLLKDELGFSAHFEEQNVTVLNLLVESAENFAQHSKPTIGGDDPFVYFKQEGTSFLEVSMDYFVDYLDMYLHSPIINSTDLEGLYDFKLKFDRPLMQSNRFDVKHESIQAGLREIGLNLIETKDTVSVLVVDEIIFPEA